MQGVYLYVLQILGATASISDIYGELICAVQNLWVLPTPRGCPVAKREERNSLLNQVQHPSIRLKYSRQQIY